MFFVTVYTIERIMNVAVQTDFFHEVTSEDILRAELTALKESHHSVRKKLFAENAKLFKMYMEQQEEIAYLRMKMGLSCILDRK